MKGTPDFLKELVAGAREDLATRRKAKPLRVVLEEAHTRHPKSLLAALKKSKGPAIIAEIKRASPSRGNIREDIAATEVAKRYEHGGASAISVLTEGRRFKGSLQDIEEIAKHVSLPILRKDFLTDPYQIWEARAAGASAILLIVALLRAKGLEELLECAGEANLDSLVEVHTHEELEIAVDAGAALIGVNARNLATMQVDLQTCVDLGYKIPKAAFTVAESGIKSREDIARLAPAGYRGFLVGETLMRADDPALLIRQLKGEG